MSEPTATHSPAAVSAASMRWPFHPILKASAAAIAVTALGAVLPWAKVGALSFTGTEGGGALNLILGGLALLALLFGRGRRWALALNVVCAALATMIVFVNLADVERFANGFDAVSTGSGLWVSAIGVGVWLLCGLVAIVRRRRLRPVTA